MIARVFIDGIETIYSISDTAELVNTTTKKELNGWIACDGYRIVTLAVFDKSLCRNRFIKKPIHRLVAQAFIPNPDNKPQVNHIDGNKLNNCVSNLEWVTNRENYNHARKIGLIKTGEDLSYSTVDNATVHKICSMIESGRSNIEIIKEIGLPNDPSGKGLITRIRTGRSWKDISNQYDFIKKGSLKKVPDTLIHEICKELCKTTSIKKIQEDLGIPRSEYRRLKSLVYDIRTYRCHKQISSLYDIISTTIDQLRD